MQAVEDTVHAVTLPPERDGVGSMLRTRRIELKLTQGDVANMVKLPTSRIEALEQERWEELPSGPYLRGFLRNIARALHIDAAMLMERVGTSLVESRSPESILVAPGTTHGTLPRRSGPADDRRGGRSLVFGACVFALIAALIAWSGTDSFDHTMVAAKSMMEPSHPIAVATPAPKSRETLPSPLAVDRPAQRPAAAAVPGTTSATNVALTFHFSEDSWVEVRSADGKVLLQRLNTAGSEQQVDGEAPFSLIVGNAKGVALRFRGQPVDLGPYTRDQVARFTLS
ncbi:MAG: helix-turn-helix domain-containing protein [Burkholderiaceae bacterium]